MSKKHKTVEINISSFLDKKKFEESIVKTTLSKKLKNQIIAESNKQREILSNLVFPFLELDHLCEIHE